MHVYRLYLFLANYRVVDLTLHESLLKGIVIELTLTERHFKEDLSSQFFDVCYEEDCSPAVEVSAFDDKFVKPIRGW